MKVIIYNKNLNPEFWTDKTIRPEIKVALLKIAKTFYSDIKLSIPLRDILFLGSSANYNWTPTSDVDLHLLVDFKEFQMVGDFAKQFTKSLTKNWNTEHDIHLKGHHVEVYIQDVSEENRSTGVYSLLNNKWIKEATPQNVILDPKLIQEKYSIWVNKINKAISSQDPIRLKKVLDDLIAMREVGLSTGGEFSVENLVFKILRQRDVIGKLKNSIQSLKNKALSVNDGFEATSFGPNCASTEGLPEPDYYKKETDKMRKM